MINFFAYTPRCRCSKEGKINTSNAKMVRSVLHQQFWLWPAAFVILIFFVEATVVRFILISFAINSEIRGSGYELTCYKSARTGRRWSCCENGLPPQISSLKRRGTLRSLLPPRRLRTRWSTCRLGTRCTFSSVLQRQSRVLSSRLARSTWTTRLIAWLTRTRAGSECARGLATACSSYFWYS